MKGFLKDIAYKAGFCISKANINNCEFKRLSSLLQLLSIQHLIDVGANTGQFAHNMRRSGYFEYIYSIEPYSSSYKLLLDHSKRDTKWIVGSKRIAISNYCGESNINITANSACSSLLKPTKSFNDSHSASRVIFTEPVSVVTLNSFVRNSLPTDCKFALKIDTQGNEYDVLQGTSDVLEQCGLVYVETSEIPIYDGSSESDKVISFLEDKGFKLWFKNLNIVNPSNISALQYDICFINSNFDLTSPHSTFDK